MGLFGAFKKKAEPEPEPKQEPQTLTWTQYEELWVSLTDKNLKVQKFDQDGKEYFQGGYIWEDEKSISLKIGDQVIFEMTPRSKSYAELKEWSRKKLHDVKVVAMEGEHGTYFRARLRIKIGEFKKPI